jgi:RecJ-like exonuclease
MKKLLSVVAGLSLVIILIVIIAGCAEKTKVYGQSISNSPVITIKELQDKKKDYSGKAVKIEGKITDVCQDMGCWFNVNDGTGIMYVDLEMGRNFVIPKNSANQTVVVEGKLKYDNGSLSIIGSGVKIGK